MGMSKMIPAENRANRRSSVDSEPSISRVTRQAIEAALSAYYSEIDKSVAAREPSKQMHIFEKIVEDQMS